jgi:hypothetical protein
MDSHRRGRAVQREEKRPRVTPLYRPVLPAIWVVGGVLLFVAGGFSFRAGLTVLIVLHVFFAGLVRADIKALRKQGLKWGLSRHIWFGAAVTLPFVVPAYYLYAGRKIRRENESRGYSADGEWVGSQGVADNPGESGE